MPSKSVHFMPSVSLALLMMTSAFPLTGLAVGGSDRGGGNAQPSSRADLEEIVSNMPRYAWEISDSYQFGGPIEMAATPLKPELATITTSVLGARSFAITDSAYKFIQAMKFAIVDGPCTDGGSPTDASTVFQKGAPVCLSASRLSRFPKSTLREAILPLIFHEMAHQFGLGEPQAVALQKLAAVHLKYRPIYLSSLRAQLGCGMVTSVVLAPAEKKDILNWIGKEQVPPPMDLPKLTGESASQALMVCAARATSAGESIARVFDGDIWQAENPSNLTSDEQRILRTYRRHTFFAFATIEESLTEPAITGYYDCSICKERGLDPAYLMMLAARAALSHIASEVGRLQNEINP